MEDWTSKGLEERIKKGVCYGATVGVLSSLTVSALASYWLGNMLNDMLGVSNNIVRYSIDSGFMAVFSYPAFRLGAFSGVYFGSLISMYINIRSAPDVFHEIHERLK